MREQTRWDSVREPARQPNSRGKTPDSRVGNPHLRVRAWFFLAGAGAGVGAGAGAGAGRSGKTLG